MGNGGEYLKDVVESWVSGKPVIKVHNINPDKIQNDLFMTACFRNSGRCADEINLPAFKLICFCCQMMLSAFKQKENRVVTPTVKHSSFKH